MVWGWICLLICLAHKYPFLVFSQKPILPSHLSSGPSADLLMGKQPSITVLPMVRCMQQMAGSHSVLQSFRALSSRNGSISKSRQRSLETNGGFSILPLTASQKKNVAFVSHSISKKYTTCLQHAAAFPRDSSIYPRLN